MFRGSADIDLTQKYKDFKHASASRFPWTILVVSVTFLMTVAGCDEQSTSPHQTGSIIGMVEPIDQWLRPVEDKSGITVSLDGTSYTDSTNTEGRYELEDVKTGIYTITFNQQGFGTNKIPFFDFVGGGDVYVEDPTNPLGNETPLVGEIPTYTVEIDSIHLPEGGYSPIEISFSETVPDSGSAMVVVFQGSSPDISADPLDHDFFQVFFVPAGYNGLVGDIIVDAAPGETRYVRAYPGAGISVFADPDAKSSNWAWASLGTPSEAKSIALPSEKITARALESIPKGEFVLYDKNDEVIERTFVGENATREDLIKLYHKYHNKILRIQNE